MAKEKFAEFRPARRIFAGRGRPMLTFGEWRLLIVGQLFGALVSAAWLFDAPAEPLTLSLAQPASSPAPAGTPAIGPALAADILAAPAGNARLPQIVLAEDDGRRGRADSLADYSGRVARVIDGETFYLEGVRPPIRLFALDAPGSDEPGFEAASDALARLVGAEPLSCKHVDTDGDSSVVARCVFADGADLAAKMIASGTAREDLARAEGRNPVD